MLKYWETTQTVAESNKMRIALVGLTHPFRGGISHYTTLLCHALMERHHVRFFAFNRQYPNLLFPGKTQKDASPPIIRVPNDPCLDSINPLSWLLTLKKIISFRPDFILFSWWHPFFAPAFGTMAYLSWWLARIPSCYLCHNIYPHERTRPDRILLRYAFGSAQGFITHSQRGCEQIQRRYPHRPVYKAHHPDYGAFAGGAQIPMSRARERLGLSGKRILLFFGVVRKYKGLNYLLKAMQWLPPSDGYHLVVAGEFYEDIGTYRSELKRLLDKGQLTLVDRYVPNAEVGCYFSAADLVVLPYLSINQSGVLQMAYGFLKPVIATTVGGIPEVVTDGSTGYLVPPGDSQAIAMAVERFFVHPDRDLFQKNIQRHTAVNTWDDMVRSVEKMGKTLTRHAQRAASEIQ